MTLSGCPFHNKVNTGSLAESPVSPSPANVGWGYQALQEMGEEKTSVVLLPHLFLHLLKHILQAASHPKSNGVNHLPQAAFP